MPDTSQFPTIFEQLKSILLPYASNLVVKHDTSDHYFLNQHYSEKWKKELFFGSVQIKKNYVSYYLMPVYMYPYLLDGLSPGLRKHMQGKSCFNFKVVDENLFSELAELTQKAVEECRRIGT